MNARTASPTGFRSARSVIRRRAQRGQVVLFTVLLLALGITILAYTATSDVARRLQSDEQTTRALAQAKEALIGRAVADPNKPGSLPCPDALTNIPGINVPNDGIADLLSGTACPSYIGRLPWRTLGVGDLRDAAGERLWYVLSPNFRPAGVEINSNSTGTLTVHTGSTAVNLATETAAVIIAPGGSFGTQLRDGVVAACTAPAGSIARNLCAANYLESAADGSWNNASTGGPYMSAQATASFNDRVVVLRTSDFIPLVEQRVGREVRDILIRYQRTTQDAEPKDCAHGCFPWPDSTNDGNSNSGSNRGRLPITAAPYNWGSILKHPTADTPHVLPSLPAYFADNNWRAVLYYTVGRDSLQNFGVAPPCTTCVAPMLAVDKQAAHGVVMIMPGAIAAGQTRTTWTQYLTNPQNRDADAPPPTGCLSTPATPCADDAYFSPDARVLNRNRLFTIAGSIPPLSCDPNAQALIRNAPCHTTGTNVKPVCQHAAKNLSGCSCAGAANVMLQPPCRNTLNPPECRTAVKELQGCSG